MESPILSEDTLLKSFGKVLVLFFLPHLLAFILQSNRLLRIYIALLEAPNPDPPAPEPEQTPDSVKPLTFGREWRVISAIFVLSIISVVQFTGSTMFQNLSLETFVEATFTFNKYIMYIVLFFFVADITAQISYPGKTIVHRTPKGGCVTVKQGLQTTNQPLTLTLFLAFRVIIGIFAFLMVGGLSESNNLVPIAVVTMGYVASIMMIMARWPLRPLIILFSLCVMSGVVFAFISLKFAGTSNSASEQESVWISNIFKSLGYLLWIPLTSMSSFVSGAVIACALRFDFNRTLLSEPGPNIFYEVAPHPSDPKMGKGIVVPQSLPFKFPKPYYTLALTTWSLVRIAIFVLYLVTGFPLKSVYETCQLAVLVEFPIMIIALFILATMRGESKALWNYEEKWTVDMKLKVSASTLEEGEPLLANEDK